VESSGRARTLNYNWSMQLMSTSSRQAAVAKGARPAPDGGEGASSALFDETLPFPPPLHRGVRSIPAKSDRTERGLSGPGARGLSLEQLPEASLALVRQAELGPESETPAQPAPLVRAADNEVALGRLHWRGRELSPEFHAYALRVARGENLEPFRGQLLAGESAASPWESVDSRPLRSKTPRVVGLLLAALALAAVVSGSLTSHEEAQAWIHSVPVVPQAATLQPAPLTVAEAASSLQSPSAPATDLASPVAASPPVPPRAPRKVAAPTSAAVTEAKGPSPLLVEEPPF
jgi:hypothetical protein